MDKKKINIIYLLLAITYGVVAILGLVFGLQNNEILKNNTSILGVFISLSSIPHLLIYVVKNKIDNSERGFFVFGLFGFLIGCLVCLIESISVIVVCIIWGIFDLCRSFYEILLIVLDEEYKKPTGICELLISLGEILFGILLIVHTGDGLNVHLIYLAISFTVYLILQIIEINSILKEIN